VAIEAIEE
jgi:hypothetical protein